jgi:hypothetical protein
MDSMDNMDSMDRISDWKTGRGQPTEIFILSQSPVRVFRVSAWG